MRVWEEVQEEGEYNQNTWCEALKRKTKSNKNLETVVVRSNSNVVPTTATVACSVAAWTECGNDIEIVFNHFIWPNDHF